MLPNWNRKSVSISPSPVSSLLILGIVKRTPKQPERLLQREIRQMDLDWPHAVRCLFHSLKLMPLDNYRSGNLEQANKKLSDQVAQAQMQISPQYN